MNLNINPKTNAPYKILWFGDMVVLSGFGRIGNEITKRLKQRGYEVQGVGIQYAGWPHDLPFHIWPLFGQDLWGALTQIVNGTQPDVLISCQDFPYHQTIWNACRIDFSKFKWLWITPIDGTPIHPDWLKMGEVADGKMVISKFGQEALRRSGVRVNLLQPGIDPREFYAPETDTEVAELKAKAGYAADDFIVGIVCMNQGRKAIPAMIQGFAEFAIDKPNAKLYLDMDKTSPAGWDIPNLLTQMGWTDEQKKRVKYKEDLFVPELLPTFAPLRNRYVLMSAHMVISHREGFGLPLLESMACRVPTLALDWCSGPEIVGDGRGVLVDRIAYMEHGTWGGAQDAFPDLKSLTLGLERIYTEPIWAQGVAAVGYEWAQKQTWDAATDAVEKEIQNALKRDRSQEPHGTNTNASPTPHLSDTHGPAVGSEQTENALGDHPIVQPTRDAADVSEVAIQDELAIRATGTTGDNRTG